MGRPFEWAERLSVAVHNLLAWLSGWRMHPVALLLVWVAILAIRVALLVLDAVVKAAALLLLFLGRQAEYKADAVATKLGYGRPLIAALADMESQHEAALAYGEEPVPTRSFWDTHPSTPDRIAKIQEILAQI